MISLNKHYLEGRKHFDSGNFASAVAAFTQAIVQEENPGIYSERGVAYLHLGQKHLSLADMEYAAGLEPENPYRYSSRAFVKDAMGDLEGAIADYELAISLDPDDAIAHNNLGMLLEKQGHKAAANQRFATADRLAGATPSILNLEAEKQAPLNEPIEPKSLASVLWTTVSTRRGWADFFRFLGNGLR